MSPTANANAGMSSLYALVGVSLVWVWGRRPGSQARQCELHLKENDQLLADWFVMAVVVVPLLALSFIDISTTKFLKR